MSFEQLWPSLLFAVAVAAVQWWATRRLHRQALARAQARHLKAQQLSDKLLQQSRQQNTQLQHELETARLGMRRQRVGPAAVPQPEPAARAALTRMLDAAPELKRSLQVDGFAETMPSMQFQTSAMGSI